MVGKQAVGMGQLDMDGMVVGMLADMLVDYTVKVVIDIAAVEARKVACKLVW